MSLEAVRELEGKWESELSSSTTAEQLGRIYEEYLGRNGKVRQLFSTIGRLPPESRKDFGAAINAFKAKAEEQFNAKKAVLGSTVAQAGTGEFFDVSIPGKRPRPGRRHPVYQTMQEICDTFTSFGFDVVYGPEIETEKNNFEALNIPREHPSRDPWDSFFIDRDNLLRSHTSPVQVRAMRQRKPPLRIVCPGRVYRPDTPDAGHLPMFHQVEGLMVGESVTFAHLKTVLDIFARAYFGPDVRSRFRPSFFPFTEPSAEMDISCVICGAKGCPACKQSGWIEILGAGMVHPKVFQNVGYNPEQVTGFAFGMGVERITMMKYGVSDIRYLVENRFSFLEQF
jgi:phenylalanyl-tRNA synthetase alpha chain